MTRLREIDSGKWSVRWRSDTTKTPWEATHGEIAKKKKTKRKRDKTRGVVPHSRNAAACTRQMEGGVGAPNRWSRGGGVL